ncbi:dihydrofolate reductase [Devosia sp. ZB163]|uniref:dihydrofolate reductase n=1 Tax=Devosia sp. ZB163 TaxID=3025938 RepID=UPI0023629659|nr:dihydrofolate reductase [Devosia sp. ZB163]MDC9824379.1 dihydrofolate reductase [Devosia sp. ZB163]
MTVPVAMIAAMGENGVIGAAGEIPWRLPTDFAHFKRTTLGKPLIMGRKTFESIGKPLPGRTNIVVTRQQGYEPDGVVVVDSLAAALEKAQAIAAADGAGEVMIGGGGEIYREAMPLAERLYVTHVALAPAGDAYFPAIDPSIWEAESIPELVRTERDSSDFTVRIYRRRQTGAR